MVYILLHTHVCNYSAVYNTFNSRGTVKQVYRLGLLTLNTPPANIVCYLYISDIMKWFVSK